MGLVSPKLKEFKHLLPKVSARPHLCSEQPNTCQSYTVFSWRGVPLNTIVSIFFHFSKPVGAPGRWHLTHLPAELPCPCLRWDRAGSSGPVGTTASILSASFHRSCAIRIAGKSERARHRATRAELSPWGPLGEEPPRTESWTMQGPGMNIQCSPAPLCPFY